MKFKTRKEVVNMTDDLKKRLGELRLHRLDKYSNSGYQRFSNDWFLKRVPDELENIWSGSSEFSFKNLNYDKEIDNMSDDELRFWIDKEERALAVLESIYSKIEIE